jgi:L-threonylcarbamoyladenylate synthase
VNDPLQQGAEAIAHGGIVAAATESFFGLHVHALDVLALDRLFAAKGRRPTEPVPVLVHDVSALERLVDGIPALARPLMARYWPGPLTLVFRARAGIPRLVCGGTEKIGLRIPGACPAADLLRRCGLPITATSANRSGEPPLSRAEDVIRVLGSAVDVVVPGIAPGGVPSTVVDVTGTSLRIIRAGAVEIAEGR